MGFSKMQQEYFQKATHRWNIKQGATRSGKTYMDYFVIPKRIRRVSGEDGLVVLLGNTKGTLQRNIIEPLQNLWGVELVSNIRSDNTAILFGEKCYCLGADKVNQVDRLRGSSIKYCYGDEVVTWHEDVFEMLKSRLDKPYSRFDGTCNPDNPYHWFKQFLDGNADIYSQQYCIDDNPYLDPAFVDNLKREYEGTVYYDRYILGRWTIAEGLVYPMFNREYHIKPTEPRPYQQYYISCDYGTQNPMSMGLWGLANEKWYRIKEYYHSGRDTGWQKTDEEYYDALVELAGNKNISAVIVDPSAASFIACIKKHGKFRVKKADNDVLNGIQNVATQLKQGNIFINDCCKDCISEFEVYSWDSKAKEDKVIKEHDHAMDDVRYFVNTVISRPKNFSFD